MGVCPDCCLAQPIASTRLASTLCRGGPKSDFVRKWPPSGHATGQKSEHGTGGRLHVRTTRARKYSGFLGFSGNGSAVGKAGSELAKLYSENDGVSSRDAKDPPVVRYCRGGGARMEGTEATATSSCSCRHPTALSNSAHPRRNPGSFAAVFAEDMPGGSSPAWPGSQGQRVARP